MTVVLLPAPEERDASPPAGRRGRWREIVASPLVLAAALSVLAFGVRSVGLTRSFELWVDEMLYADLGASVARGEVPTLPDGPFFLHPPGFYVLEAAVIRVLGLDTSDSMSLVYDLRWLAAALGALSVALAFLLVRRVAGTWPAVWAALVLAFEPFVLRNNSRVFLETAAGLAVLAGLLVITGALDRRGRARAGVRLFLGGLLLGYAVLTKDVFAFYAVAPVLAAVLWRRTLRVREACPVLLGIVAPYATYLGFLGGAGHLGNWWTAKELGMLRLVGAEQATGFNAPDAPDLVGRMVEQVQHYGTSYVLLALCPLAGIVAACSRRPDRRLVGLAAVVMGLLGFYLAAFGTFEEHFGYPIMLASVTALAVSAVEVAGRRPRLRRAVMAGTAALLAAAVAFGVRLELTEDDGFRSFRAWTATELPADAAVGVTNDTGVRAFAGDERFGQWSTAAQLEANGASYVLTVSLPTRQGYALATPEFLEWLELNATPVFRDSGPTNGETVLWSIEPQVLSDAAARGIGGPPPPPLDPGTSGRTAPEGGDSGAP